MENEHGDPSLLKAVQTYTLLESIALTQRRLGADGLRMLVQEILPAIETTMWIDNFLGIRLSCWWLMETPGELGAYQLHRICGIIRCSY